MLLTSLAIVVDFIFLSRRSCKWQVKVSFVVSHVSRACSHNI
uniref:Uncharacterized protein n=1 Tax=Anguilla anguilla TaxID=7936 RepID=A0A0E9S9P5_ANGAN